MDDAFAIRGMVMVGMCVFAGLGLVGIVAVGMKIWGWANR